MMKFEKIFRISWVLVGLVSVFLVFMDHLPQTGGDGRPFMLFFTSWSVFVSYFAVIFSLLREEPSAKVVSLRFSAAIMSTTTFLISAFVIPEKIWTAGFWTFSSLFKHFLFPILTVSDFLIFTRRGAAKPFHPFLAVVLPVIYWLCVIPRFLLARRSFGGKIPEELQQNYYPYAFTNIDGGMSLSVLLLILFSILIFLVALGFFFRFLLNRKR